MSVTGNYISETDVTNFDAESDAVKQDIIDRIEAMVEQIAHDYFYPKNFDIRINGNGKNRLFFPFRQKVIYVGTLEISDIAVASSEWNHDEDSIYLNLLAAELFESEYDVTELFPKGNNNIHLIGELGWPEKLDIDTVIGTYEVGETITGGASGATAIVKEVASTYLKIAGRSSTNFNNNEQVVGGTSEATADVDNTNGAVNDPPKAIKQACVILAEREVDPTLYTGYSNLKSEKLGDYSYSRNGKYQSGVLEADRYLIPYINKRVSLSC